MKKNMKKLIIISCLLILPVSVFSFSFGADNHSFNPALLGTSSRTWLQTGVTADIGFGNNYFAINDFLVGPDEEPVLVIDLGELYDAIKDDGLDLNLNAKLDVFSTLRIWKLGVGAYVTVDAFADTTLPADLFQFLAEGNKEETTFTLNEGLKVRSFLEAGAYAGFRAGNFQIGVKVGQYLPLAYTKDVAYDLEITMQNEQADEDGNIITGTGTVGGKLFTSFDVDDPESALEDPEMFLEYAGTKVDAGIVYARRQGVPLWGVSASIPITPARAAYTYNISGDVAFALKSPIEFMLDEENEEEELFEMEEDIVFERDFEAEPEEIFSPMKFGAFYRIGFIPILDFIPYGQVVIEGDETMFGGGMAITGAFFPLSWVTVSAGYFNEIWSASAALDVDLRLAEIGVRVSNSAKEFEGLMRVGSPRVTLHAAVGL